MRLWRGDRSGGADGASLARREFGGVVRVGVERGAAYRRISIAPGLSFRIVLDRIAGCSIDVGKPSDYAVDPGPAAVDFLILRPRVLRLERIS